MLWHGTAFVKKTPGVLSLGCGVWYCCLSGNCSFGIMDVERSGPSNAHFESRKEMKSPKSNSIKKDSAAKSKGKVTSCATQHRMSTTNSKSSPKAGSNSKSASKLVDARTRSLVDWREDTLARMRALILEADPEMIEERKWKKPSNDMAGVPVWSHNGIVCTGETYAKVVKLTFARGAFIPDPARLFNSSLEGNLRRAIDIREGEKVDARAFKALVKAAVTENTLAKKR
jgi:hypothetical protein